MEVSLDARLTSVTVFPDQAQVTRTGTVEVPEPGEHVLRVDGLPLLLQADSLRATGRGPAGTKLLGVELAVMTLAQPPEAAMVALREELERLRRELALQDERIAAQTTREEWLHGLGNAMTRSLARGIAKGSAKTEDVSAFFAYADEQAAQNATRLVELKRQRDDLQRQVDARQREYDQQGSQRHPDRKSALVRLQVAAAGSVTIELSYLIRAVAWHPRYDARVDTVARTVKLTQQAVVVQRTGEAWEGVALALSTARPSAAVRLPDEPEPWYLDVYRPAPPPPQVKERGAVMFQRSLAAPMAAAPAGAGMDYAAEGDSFEAEPQAIASAAVGMERAGAAQLFRLPGGTDVPSDGSPHLMGIGEHEFAVSLEYAAQPAFAEGAHLRAVARNEAGRVLLPGELHIFHVGTAGDEYMGQTQLELTAEHAELPLYLGVDDNVRVKRELIERETDKGSLLQRGVRKTTFGYRVTVGNHTGSAQRVVLQDTFPVPRHEKIRLTVLEIRPQPSEHTKLEQLSWTLDLAAGEEKRVEWRFVVETPTDAQVIGLP